MYKKTRKIKRFHTTIDADILKELKIEAIEREISVGKLIELLWIERKKDHK